MNKTRIITAVLIANLLLAANSAKAQEDEDKWSLRFMGTSAWALEADSGSGDPGVGLGIEYRPSSRLSFGLDVLSVQTESRLDLGSPGMPELSIGARLEMSPAIARVHWHFTPDRRVDLYAGPAISYISYDGIEVFVDSGSGPAEVARFTLDDDSAFGATLGLDARLGQGRSFASLALTYLDGSLKLPEQEERGSLDLLILTLGVGIRF